jgi:hypothetical protein
MRSEVVDVVGEEGDVIAGKHAAQIRRQEALLGIEQRGCCV